MTCQQASSGTGSFAGAGSASFMACAGGALGRAGEAEGAVAMRDWEDTQRQGVHGPWGAGQRRRLRAP